MTARPEPVPAGPDVGPEPWAPALVESWDRLVDRLEAGPFVRPGWVETWSAAFGRRRPEVVTARRDGRLAGVLPLVTERGRALRSPTNVHTPQFAVVAEDDAVATALVGAALARRPRRLSLAYLAGDRAALTSAAAAARYRVAERELMRSPFVDVDGDWEAYQAGLRRGLRAELRRGRRRLAERGEPSFTVARGDEALDRGLADLLAIEAGGWKGRRGTAIASGAATLGFYRQVAASGAARDTLRLAGLRVDGEAVATMLVLEEQGVQYAVKAAYAEAFAGASPGRLLLGEVVHQAFDDPGVRRVELLGADEPYKVEWATGVRPRVLWQAFAPTVAGRVDAAVSTTGRELARRSAVARSAARFLRARQGRSERQRADSSG